MATSPDVGASCSRSEEERVLRALWERLAQAEDYKEAGNQRYRAGNVRGAVGKYHRALLFLRGLDAKLERGGLPHQLGLVLGGLGGLGGESRGGLTSLPDDIRERATFIEQGCLNNLAACLLLQDKPNYEKVITYCDRVLDVSPDNPKALYRKGCSCYHLGRYDDSYSSLKKAQQISKADPNIRKFLLLAREKVSHMKKTERTLYKEMFKEVTTESNGGQEAAAAEPNGL